MDKQDLLYVTLPRDPARARYRRSPTSPLYAWLVVQDREVRRERLVLVTADGERLIEKAATATEGRSNGNTPVETVKSAAVEATATSVPTVEKAKVVTVDQATTPVTTKVQAKPLSRYRDLGDGTVLDRVTGLQWMRCALGQTWYGVTCHGKATEYRWNAMFWRVKVFNLFGGYAGHRDWRVPTIEELKTLIVEGVEPAIDKQAFPCGAAWFWSSSPTANNSSNAWIVYFNYGNVNYNDKGIAYHVRLVRGGQ